VALVDASDWTRFRGPDGTEISADSEPLKRHLICFDRNRGTTRWQKTVDAFLPEDEYPGMGVPEHGYSSHTPVSDGKNVYVFFGKSGVFACDLEGTELWNAKAGTQSDDRSWGSSSSPIIVDNVLVVPAGPESRADRSPSKPVAKVMSRQRTSRGQAVTAVVFQRHSFTKVVSI